MAKKNRTYSEQQILHALAYAMDNSGQRAKKNSDDYIRLNPQDKERRERDLAIEQIGINNLYYEFLRQLDAINNPYGIGR